MSSIAQKLCDQICEGSSVKQSNPSVRENLNQIKSASSKNDDRPTRSITVEKKREINKVVPNFSTSNKSRIVINKFKSKETLLKKTFFDIGLNTIITGPLRCDNDCETMIRKRDRDSCKCCNKRPNCKTNVKEMQTFKPKNITNLDKACAHYQEMVNCGTQFLERLSSRNIEPNKVSSKSEIYESDYIRGKAKPYESENAKSVATLYEPDDFRSKEKFFEPNNDRANAKLCMEGYTQTVENKRVSKDLSHTRAKIDDLMGARRWALSRYSRKGPDF